MPTGLKLSEKFFKICKSNIKNKVQYIKKDEDNVYMREWKLYVPEILESVGEEILKGKKEFNNNLLAIENRIYLPIYMVMFFVNEREMNDTFFKVDISALV